MRGATPNFGGQRAWGVAFATLSQQSLGCLGAELGFCAFGDGSQDVLRTGF